jgi:DNA-binding transcriptional regulator GbsR (MarR family)
MLPFEGVLGNNCALRILEFLLPREDLEFNIQELADNTGVSWPTAHKIVEKYAEWGIIKENHEHGSTVYYELNSESPFVELFENFNNLIIEQMLGEETLYQIHDHWEAHSPPRKQLEQETEGVSNQDFSFEAQTSWQPFEANQSLRTAGVERMLKLRNLYGAKIKDLVGLPTFSDYGQDPAIDHNIPDRYELAKAVFAPLECEGTGDEPPKRLVFQIEGKSIDLKTVIDLTVEETYKKMVAEKQAVRQNSLK